MGRMGMTFQSISFVGAVRIAAFLFLTCTFAACSQNSGVSTPEPDSAPVSEFNSTAQILQGSKIPYNIGDITYGFYATLTMDRRSLPDSIAYEEEFMKNFDYRVTLANARVARPYPEQIPMKILVGTVLIFPGDAVMVTARLIVDKKEVDSFEYIFGEKMPVRDIRFEEVDLRSYLEGTPESVLVRVELIATLFKHTEAASIDPETVERPADDTVTVYSNPMRVNFTR